MRAAIQYGNYWIGQKTDQIQVANHMLNFGLASLLHEIDPTNLEFLDSSHNFLKALNKFSTSQTVMPISSQWERGL